MLRRRARAEAPDCPRPAAGDFVGANRVRLLEGGDELFPAMCAAIGRAEREVFVATYIYDDDPAARRVTDALVAAARRGIAVYVVVDGFGSRPKLAALRQLLGDAGVRFEVFRPLDHWWAWLQPGQLRRLHQKLCVVDERVAQVGGINVIDDRHDVHHGWSERPRLDFAVEVDGPLARLVHASARALWSRARMGSNWREELRSIAASTEPVEEALNLLRSLRRRPQADERPAVGDRRPVQAAFVTRDNLGQRRAIERRYVEAMRRARHAIDLAVPYFYPGQVFRRVLRQAARRGVRVRLLLQGKLDYRIAGLAARALYAELQAYGVRIYEYTPAFLHAKVAVVDDDWATVGSSNIDPLSLLLNLEANVVVQDLAFARELRARFEVALAESHEVAGSHEWGGGWRALALRGIVAWSANIYLRVAGITGRY